MNKDLHDMDDLFRSALDQYEETPSAGVKERLEAALDMKGDGPSKIRFFGWKKTTLLLLLLLTGFVLYESGFLKTSTGRSNEGIADHQKDYASGEKYKEKYQKTSSTDNINNDDAGSYNKEAIKSNVDNANKTLTGENTIIIQPKPKEISVAARTGIINKAGYEKNSWGNKIVAQTNNPDKVQHHDKNMNSLLETNDPLPKEITNLLPSLKDINISKIAGGLAHSITPLQAINDSILKSNTAKNTKGAKLKLFKPFWMLTTFASYERASYRLDSDLPANITKIKHSEVHEPSFSLGILTTRQIKKRWGLQTGLIYSQTDIGISPQKLYALQDRVGDISFKYITSSGYAYIKPGLGAPPAIGDSLVTKEGKHSLKLVSIPLVVKYTVVKNKLSFIPGAGIEANFLTSAKVETELESPSNPEIIFINKLDGAKPFYLSLVADAELRYKLNSKLSVSFRPAIRLATSPVTKNNVVETFPHSIGVGMGLTWKF